MSVQEAQRLFDAQQYPGQIFTCSAIRYAREFQAEEAGLPALGKLRYIAATVPKDWEKYAVHIIEPLLNIAKPSGELSKAENFRADPVVTLNVAWSCGFHATITTLGDIPAPLALRLVGEEGWKDLFFSDTFFAFKAALQDFVSGVREKSPRIDPVETMAVVQLIEAGRY